MSPFGRVSTPLQQTRMMKPCPSAENENAVPESQRSMANFASTLKCLVME